MWSAASTGSCACGSGLYQPRCKKFHVDGTKPMALPGGARHNGPKGRDHGQSDHDPGCRVQRGEIHVGRGPVPTLRAQRASGAPVQAAEHVQQCRRHRRRGRDWPRSGASGAGRRRAPTHRHEPSIAQARNGRGRAGDCTGQTLCHVKGTRLRKGEAGPSGCMCRKLSPPCGRGGPDHCRGCWQPR